MGTGTARVGGIVVAVLWVAWAALFPAWGQTGPVIREIRVEGIERIEPETVRSYMRIRAGEPYDPAKVDRSLKNLFNTGLFADVSIRRDGDVLIVRVVENPIINRLAFEGNSVLDEEVLRNEVRLRPRVVYTRTRVQNDVRRIIEIYRREGRFAVSVEPKVIERSQNRVDLVFEINEGPPTRIRSVDFIGNEAFSDSRLESVIQSAETRWYAFLTSDDIYDPDRLKFDEELLRRHYLANGYPDFQVLSTVAELSPDRQSFFITFTVEEGPRYRFGEIGIESRIRDLDTSALREVLSVEQGAWYNADAVEESINRLTDAVGNQGFAFIEIRPQLDRDSEARTVGVTFEIMEGPRVFVERIDIHGNVRTEDRVIRREFRLVEGDAFNTAKFRRSQQRLRSLGYFKKVEVKKLPGSAPDRAVIDVEVEEQATGSFSIGGGFSSTAGLITQVSLTERNLLGKGQTASVTAQLGTKRQQFEVSFTEPFFLGRNLSAGIDAFNSTNEATDSITFDQERTGGNLRLGFSYNERLRQSVNYKLLAKKVSDVDEDASLFVKQQEGEAVTSSVGQSLTYDVRDSRLNPTEGFVARLSNDLAGLGGDNRFLRTQISATTHHKLIFDWSGQFGARAGYIKGLGEDIRIDDRYFIGGDSLRGFAPGGIGPRDEETGDALGGNAFMTASAEVGIPIGTSTSFRPRGFLFSDVGTLVDVDDEGAGIQEDESLRVSLGVGIGVQTPFGTIRLNLATPVVKADFDETEVFTFSFGTGF